MIRHLFCTTLPKQNSTPMGCCSVLVRDGGGSNSRNPDSPVGCRAAVLAGGPLISAAGRNAHESPTGHQEKEHPIEMLFLLVMKEGARIVGITTARWAVGRRRSGTGPRGRPAPAAPHPVPNPAPPVPGRSFHSTDAGPLAYYTARTPAFPYLFRYKNLLPGTGPL